MVATLEGGDGYGGGGARRDDGDSLRDILRG
jgi:hypothetical protein